MNDRELCEMFGTTLEQVEKDVEIYESGDLSSFSFSSPQERSQKMSKEQSVKSGDAMRLVFVNLPENLVKRYQNLSDLLNQTRNELMMDALEGSIDWLEHEYGSKDDEYLEPNGESLMALKEADDILASGDYDTYDDAASLLAAAESSNHSIVQ